MSHRRLSIGLLLPNGGARVWHEPIVDAIESSEVLYLRSVDLDPSAESVVAGDRKDPAVGWNLARQLDRFMVRLLPGIPKGFQADSERHSTMRVDKPGTFDEGSTDALDLLIDLRETGGRFPATKAAHRIWRLRVSASDDEMPTAAPGMLEYLLDESCTIITLLETREGSGQERPVRIARVRTNLLSWTANTASLRRRAALIVCDALGQLQGDGHTYFWPDNIDIVDGKSPRSRAARHKARPTARQVVALMVWRMVRKAWAAAKSSFKTERWAVIALPALLATQDLRRYSRVSPPDARFWADPFLISERGQLWLFFEEFDFVGGKGVISCAQVNGGKAGPSRVVLNLPCHLSYPFLFRHGDKLYMIPETSGRRTVELWQCHNFPYDWRHSRNLFEDISAVDATLLNWANRWWLFMAIDRLGDGDRVSELHIFHTDDPVTGEWHGHQRNPVAVDVTRARMGGGFLSMPDGRLLRVAQRCDIHYGYGLALCEVLTLSELEYRERVVRRIEPTWDPRIRRIHHLVVHGDLAVLDIAGNV